MRPDPIQVALRVADECERLGLSYLIGGSLASSVAGEPRSTLDVDVVLAIAEEQVPLLVRAIREKGCANLVHLATAIKVDIFVLLACRRY